MPKTRSFNPYKLVHGLLEDMRKDQFPTMLSAWSDNYLEMGEGATHFGYVYEGYPTLNCHAGQFNLSPGMYFSVNNTASIHGNSKGIIVSRLGYRGFFQIGGPVEEKGRLKYIDGCTDSLLIPPVLMGDPCLNLLYFPPGINQTPHTHPSMRVGMVIRGSGHCLTPSEKIPLFPGQVFVIPANGQHSFYTEMSSMTVIAYHPDSDFGPTHENHPMINRTMVSGRSASGLVSIRTK